MPTGPGDPAGLRDPAGPWRHRYEGADIEPASLAAWRLLMEQLISSANPAIAFIGFLQTVRALPERTLSQPRVFVSHRMADVPYAERIAWLASRKAGLEYSLDVHDLIAASSQRGPSVRPSGLCYHTVAAIIAMVLLTLAVAAEHVVATFAVDSLGIAHRVVPDLMLAFAALRNTEDPVKRLLSRRRQRPFVPRSRAQQSAASCWMERISAGRGRRTCGFFRSFREQHDRTGQGRPIADTISEPLDRHCCNRPQHASQRCRNATHFLMLQSRGMRHQRSALIMFVSPWHKPHEKARQGRFFRNRFFPKSLLAAVFVR
jgi:hypothetical protein